jgi:phage replication-related protein YjqB (UPF0714/DUF867 family)
MKKGKSVSLLALIVILFTMMLLMSQHTKTEGQGNDKYKDFEQLSQNEQQDVDYKISFNKTNSDVLLMAIHGGSIESGTTELVDQIALEANDSYYTFQGIKEKNNVDLHITSSRFNEPVAIDLVSDSLYTLSFHGYKEEEKQHTYIDGLDKQLAETLRVALDDAGFSVSSAPKAMEGKEKSNIVNKNKQKKGVQLEISTAQRKAFFTNDDFSSANRENKTEAFYAYTKAIQNALHQ